MIKDLPINTNGKLTADVKKQLMLIIDQEFRSKNSLYHQIKMRERDKIINAYKKYIGYDKLKKKLDNAEQGIKEAQIEYKKCEEDISDTGLKIDGELNNQLGRYVNGVYVENIAVKKIQHELDVLEQNAPSETLRAKLITRLMLSTTIGEANEVMREILGNGIIPATNIKAISFQG